MKTFPPSGGPGSGRAATARAFAALAFAALLTGSGASAQEEQAARDALRLGVDRDSPQRALVTDILWTVEGAAGDGQRVFEFWLEAEGARPVLAQEGPAPAWIWKPEAPGRYRVRAVVKSPQGAATETRGEAYEILPALPRNAVIAILPPENLSDAPAPMAAIREDLRSSIERRSISLLDDETLRTFMAAHRMRYTGGLSSDLGKALLAETGASAVVISSVDSWDGSEMPRAELTARLVSTGEKTVLLWMDSAGAAGDDEPGLLARGVVHDADALREAVIARLTGSLADRLSALEAVRPAAPERPPHADGRFRPRSFYRSPRSVSTGSKKRIAVMPFINDSGRRSAGDLLSLQFVRHLEDRPEIEVVEPGIVREVLLRTRLVQSEGISLAQADVLRELLDVDEVVTGRVSEWEDARGEGAAPRVAFSSRGIDTRARQVTWTATSGNRGDDGVFFFGRGRISTSVALASEAVLAVLERALETRGR